MKTRSMNIALVAFASIPLALLQGCYTQFGSASRPDDETEYVTSDSISQDEYSDARRQFYADQAYPYSSGYMGGSPMYGGWGSGWGSYGGRYSGYYAHSPFGYYDPFYDSYYYGYGASPGYSRWGMAGWAGYGGWVGWNTAYYPVSGGGYRGRATGTSRNIGSRRSVSGSQTFVGGTRGPVGQPSVGAPAPSSFTLPSGARRGTSSSTPPAAPRILPPSNTGRRGYDGERTPHVSSTPAPAPPGSGGGRGTERHTPAPSTPPPQPSSPPPAPSGNRGGESRGDSGSSRGGNRR
jgi:hypothetical protein